MRTISRPTPPARGVTPAAPAPRVAAPPAIACVSDDPALVAALRAAAPTAQVIVVPSANALVEVLLQGACGVIAADVPVLAGAAPSLLKHLARQFPDAAIIGVGDRHDEVALAPLISSGAVYRFLHRPVSAARARVFVEAAIRRHEQRHAPAASPAPQPRPGTPGPPTGPARARPPARAAARATAPAQPAMSLRPSREWTGPRTGWPLAAAIAALIAIAIGVVIAMADGVFAEPERAPAPAVAPARQVAPVTASAAPAPARARTRTRPPSAPADDERRPAR